MINLPQIFHGDDDVIGSLGIDKVFYISFTVTNDLTNPIRSEIFDLKSIVSQLDADDFISNLDFVALSIKTNS